MMRKPCSTIPSILSAFSTPRTEEQIESYRGSPDTLLDMYLIQNGIPIEGDNFLTILDAWQAGLNECGEFIPVRRI